MFLDGTKACKSAHELWEVDTIIITAQKTTNLLENVLFTVVHDQFENKLEGGGGS